nr:unnamed protein product [Digitaria exilis]
MDSQRGGGLEPTEKFPSDWGHNDLRSNTNQRGGFSAREEVEEEPLVEAYRRRPRSVRHTDTVLPSPAELTDGCALTSAPRRSSGPCVCARRPVRGRGAPADGVQNVAA